jgi:hypothetical protein
VDVCFSQTAVNIGSGASSAATLNSLLDTFLNKKIDPVIEKRMSSILDRCLNKIPDLKDDPDYRKGGKFCLKHYELNPERFDFTEEYNEDDLLENLNKKYQIDDYYGTLCQHSNLSGYVFFEQGFYDLLYAVSSEKETEEEDRGFDQNLFSEANFDLGDLGWPPKEIVSGEENSNEKEIEGKPSLAPPSIKTLEIQYKENKKLEGLKLRLEAEQAKKVADRKAAQKGLQDMVEAQKAAKVKKEAALKKANSKREKKAKGCIANFLRDIDLLEQESPPHPSVLYSDFHKRLEKIESKYKKAEQFYLKAVKDNETAPKIAKLFRIKEMSEKVFIRCSKAFPSKKNNLPKELNKQDLIIRVRCLMVEKGISQDKATALLSRKIGEQRRSENEVFRAFLKEKRAVFK